MHAVAAVPDLEPAWCDEPRFCGQSHTLPGLSSPHTAAVPYTIGFTLFDRGTFYTVSLPTLTGVLDTSSLGPQSATSVSPPFTITFTAAPNPPDSPGALLLTDPAGPGDFLRSGPITLWPAEPASVIAGTGVQRLTFGQLSAAVPMPEIIPVLEGVGFAIGLFTAFMISPRRIIIERMTLGPSSKTGAIRATFSGIIEYFTLFVPRRTDFSGTLNLTLEPSGNAADPAMVVNVRVSDLSLTTGFISILSTF